MGVGGGVCEQVCAAWSGLAGAGTWRAAVDGWQAHWSPLGFWAHIEHRCRQARRRCGEAFRAKQIVLSVGSVASVAAGVMRLTGLVSRRALLRLLAALLAGIALVVLSFAPAEYLTSSPAPGRALVVRQSVIVFLFGWPGLVWWAWTRPDTRQGGASPLGHSFCDRMSGSCRTGGYRGPSYGIKGSVPCADAERVCICVGLKGPQPLDSCCPGWGGV